MRTELKDTAVRNAKKVTLGDLKRLPFEKVLEKFREVHGDKYDYSEVEYKNEGTKVKIYCKKHKKFFVQTPKIHWRDHGCPECGKESQIASTKMYIEEFIERASKMHEGFYKYNLITNFSYAEKQPIICLVHGEFMQDPYLHLSGSGCPKCYADRQGGDAVRLPPEQVLEDFRRMHDDKYDYSEMEYEGTEIKIKIYCKKHQTYFWQSPSSHWNGFGCQICNNSLGEEKIRLWLSRFNFNFTMQHRFADCRNKNPLLFDFYLLDHNMAIEVQGIQHFQPVEIFG
jgi:hypothetical protein